jgi:hypothetical protein
MSTVTVTTDLEVCNLALDILKESPITSLEENRTPARWMSRNFVPIRNMVLISHIWKFAMARASLAEDPVKPDFEWDHKFRKPSDCLRVIPLRVGGTLNGRLIPHVVEGDFILTDAGAPLLIRYLKVIADPALWPPLFVDAVATKLAARAAHFITGKQAMAELANVLHKEAIIMAASMDGAEGTHAAQYATAYDDVRYYDTLGTY